MRGSWRPNRTTTYWPHSIGHNRVSFPFSWAAQPGARGRGAQPLWDMFLNPVSSVQLIWSLTADFLSSPGLYNDLTPTLLPASVTIVLIQPVHGQGYNILVFLDRMHLLFTQVHFQFWQLGWVGGQYATITRKNSIWHFLLQSFYFEDYIIQILPFIIYTLLKPYSEVLKWWSRYCLWYCCDFMNKIFSSSWYTVYV